jgi:signal transduction histidine kinase
VRNKIILLACTFIVIVSAILTAYFLIQHDQTVKLKQYQDEVAEATVQQQQEDVINNFKDYYLVLNSNVHKLITNFKDNKNNILVAKIFQIIFFSQFAIYSFIKSIFNLIPNRHNINPFI